MKGRKVNYYEYVMNEETRLFEKQKSGEAKFLAFGVDFEELENGVGPYSTAILELPDGFVRNLPVEQIEFIG